MADNAIMARRNGGGDGGGAKHTVESLHQYCRDMNAMNFVIANGWEYFVNRRTLPDGKVQHYVDRRDGRQEMPRQIARQAAAALVPPREPPFGQWHPGHAD
jgi:hypothetical protein